MAIRYSWHRLALLALLTVVGFVVPNAMVYRFFSEHGLSPASARKYFGEWIATLPASQLTADLGITSASFLLWSLWDSKDRGVRHWWLVPVGTSSVGICFAVPLYFLLRELAGEHSR